MTVLSKELTRAMQQEIFSVSNAAAGVAPGTVLSTTPPLTLWNPTDSKKNLIVLEALCGYVSGTLGAGFLAYASATQATAPTGGTDLTSSIRAGVLGNTNTASAKAYTGSTLAFTPTLHKPALILQASAPFVPVPRVYEEGALIVLPGQALCLQAIAAAGASPLVVLGLTWIEARY